MSNDEQIKKICLDIASKQNDVEEKIMAQALEEVMKCGDFMRIISADRKRGAVIYQPYSMLKKMQNRIKFLEEQLKSYEDEKEIGEIIVLK